MNPKTFTDWPVSKFWVLNNLALARTKTHAVTAKSANDIKICQVGTAVADSRVIIVTGEVKGNMLRNNASGLSGVCSRLLMKISGTTSGMMTNVVNWDPSRRLGTRAPIPAIRLA